FLPIDHHPAEPPVQLVEKTIARPLPERLRTAAARSRSVVAEVFSSQNENRLVIVAANRIDPLQILVFDPPQITSKLGKDEAAASQTLMLEHGIDHSRQHCGCCPLIGVGSDEPCNTWHVGEC